MNGFQLTGTVQVRSNNLVISGCNAVALGGPAGDTRGDLRMGPYAGETEVLIPAGYVRQAYDATFALSPDKRRYVARNSETPTMLPAPGLPFSLVFRAEPGAEDRILRVASAYEAASKRRVSPPAYPALRKDS